MKLRIGSIIETALYVDDLTQSVEFYQRIFGSATLHASEVCPEPSLYPALARHLADAGVQDSSG